MYVIYYVFTGVSRSALYNDNVPKVFNNLEESYDSSIPIPFDLEKHLSDIKVRHQRRRSNPDVERYVLFVLDTSGSIGSTNFQKMLDVVEAFIPLFCQNVSFAVMTYGDKIKREICFNCGQDKTKLSIKSIKYRHGPYTRTGKAMKCACENMLTSKCGFNVPRNARMFTDVIFITDGMSNGELDPCLETKCFEDINNRYPNMDTYVFAFGIGNNVNQTEIKCIPGALGNSNSKFNLQSFHQFEQLKEQTYAQLISGKISCFVS